MSYEFTEGRAKEAPKLHMIQNDGGDLCQCVKEICDALNVNRSLTRSQREKLIADESLNMLERLTGSGQQVLWGYTWQVQGTNGLNPAQPSHPQGSTLTFQRKVGVSWAHGLRHGVTMHPRGRHLREGRILLAHGGATPQRSSHSPTQHNLQMPMGCSCRVHKGAEIEWKA